MLLFVFAA